MEWYLSHDFEIRSIAITPAVWSSLTWLGSKLLGQPHKYMCYLWQLEASKNAMPSVCFGQWSIIRGHVVVRGNHPSASTT